MGTTHNGMCEISKVFCKIQIKQTEQFIPTRGICERGPLSPYLFLIVEEGLSFMLNHVEVVGDIVGVRLFTDVPMVSHLLFADDSLILMKANAMNAEALKSVLDSYCAASGQMVSVEKSSIFFSPNTLY